MCSLHLMKFDFSGRKCVLRRRIRLIFCIKVVFAVWLHCATFNRIICKVQNQRYKTNFAQDIRLKQWMRGNEMREKKYPNRKKRIIAITTTISVAIIRQLNVFSLLQTNKTRSRRKRSGNFQFRCLKRKIN